MVSDSKFPADLLEPWLKSRGKYTPGCSDAKHRKTAHSTRVRTSLVTKQKGKKHGKRRQERQEGNQVFFRENQKCFIFHKFTTKTKTHVTSTFPAKWWRQLTRAVLEEGTQTSQQRKVQVQKFPKAPLRARHPTHDNQPRFLSVQSSKRTKYLLPSGCQSKRSRRKNRTPTARQICKGNCHLPRSTKSLKLYYTNF